jgi:hypothetical protein
MIEHAGVTWQKWLGPKRPLGRDVRNQLNRNMVISCWGQVISEPACKDGISGFRFLGDPWASIQRDESEPGVPIWCRCTGKIAEEVRLYVHQGQRLSLQGRLEARRFAVPGEEGAILYHHYLQVTSLEKLRLRSERVKMSKITAAHRRFLDAVGMDPFDVPPSKLAELGIEVPRP